MEGMIGPQTLGIIEGVGTASDEAVVEFVLGDEGAGDLVAGEEVAIAAGTVFEEGGEEVALEGGDVWAREDGLGKQGDKVSRGAGE